MLGKTEVTQIVHMFSDGSEIIEDVEDGGFRYRTAFMKSLDQRGQAAWPMDMEPIEALQAIQEGLPDEWFLRNGMERENYPAVHIERMRAAAKREGE